MGKSWGSGAGYSEVPIEDATCEKLNEESMLKASRVVSMKIEWLISFFCLNRERFKKLLLDPQTGKGTFVLIQNDKVGVAIKTFGDKESKNLRFNILVMRDLDFYQKSVKGYKEKEKD